MRNNKIIAVVSAYGTMTESDKRYMVLIHADNAEELKGKLQAFLCAETVRAMATPEIALELGPVDPKKVYDALALFTFPENMGERSVISVPELSTDYHVENPEILAQTSPDDDISAWREAIVMTDYGNECSGSSEFPSVVAIYDPNSERDQDGHPVLQKYTDSHHGTIMMTASDLDSHLLGWERHVIPVM